MMKRTTILADEHLLLEAQQLAMQRGTTLTVLLQDALREYIAAHRPRERRLSFMGMGDSGQPNLSVSNGWDEEILEREVDPIAGWAPHGDETSSIERATIANSRGTRGHSG